MRLMELGWNDRKEATKPHIEAEGISTGRWVPARLPLCGAWPAKTLNLSSTHTHRGAQGNAPGIRRRSSPTWPQDDLVSH